MPHRHFYAVAETPTLDLVVDMGNPVLNSTVNGFLKVAPVGATHAATQEAFKMISRERITKRDLEVLVKRQASKACNGVLSPGSIQVATVVPFSPALVFPMKRLEYGIHRVRGRRDWKNAAIGGAITGAVLTLGDRHFDKNKLIQTAITGGAIATANELLRCF